MGLKKRNDLVFKKICGEKNDVCGNVCARWTNDLPNLLHVYSPNAILNAEVLETLHKYFELSSVGDKFDKLHFIEKSLTENNLRHKLK